MATVKKSVSRKRGNQEVEKRISKIQKCHKLGQRILKECELHSARGKLARVAAEHEITRDQAARYRALATPETGYTRDDFDDSFEAFRNAGRALTIYHFIKLLTVQDKKKRKVLEDKAFKNQWSLRRLQLEILADCGRRYEAAGRRPSIPEDLKSAVGSVAHQVWSWRHWLEAYLEAKVSNKNVKLKEQLQQLSTQMLSVYELIEPRTNVKGVRKKKDTNLRRR